MRSEYVGQNISIMSSQGMEVGQLAEVTSPSRYAGRIILRHYSGFVSLWCPDGAEPASKTWLPEAKMEVRILDPSEKIILSNEE